MTKLLIMHMPWLQIDAINCAELTTLIDWPRFRKFLKNNKKVRVGGGGREGFSQPHARLRDLQITQDR